MRRSAAARRYARALFALAREEEAIEAFRGELDGLSRLLEAEPELGHALFRPLRPASERRDLLRALCEQVGTPELLRSFYSVLIEHRRLVDFPAIREEYGRLADEAAGRAEARVVTASPLSEEQRERLRRALASRTGKQVELLESVDPSLLGGAVATVGGLVFDGSLRAQLEQLRAALVRE